ncbi:MAG: aminotransferase class I/II-fold pyridoxal phosphate-dependent enzyme, partial [Hyphomicrobiaceae bacterium]
QASGAAGLLVASPSNPTGTMLEPERLGALIETCRQRRMWFVSDEIYHGLTYTLPARSALSFSDDVIVINSFSKYFSMTGWRVGWMVVPPALVRSVERLGQNLYISAPAASQAAALAAFEAAGELEANRSVYAANRRLLLDGLPKVGIAEFAPADGAFYLYADVSAFIPHEFADSAAMAASMLEELDIAVTPGIDFDEARGINFLRFSYSGPTADMAEAVRRLEGWDKLKGRSSSA